MIDINQLNTNTADNSPDINAKPEQQEESLVGDIIVALTSGISPDELVEKGVPIEALNQAIQIMLENQGSNERTIPAQQRGLAQP